jgi:hypothetical protein
LEENQASASNAYGALFDPRRLPMFRAVLLALLLAVVSALPASAAPAEVVTDPCGNGPSLQEGVNLAGQDICNVTVDTVRPAEEDPTTLVVTMLLAGDPTAVPSAHSVAWGAGDCTFIPFRTDRAGLGVEQGMRVVCGERLDDCSTTVPVVCEAEYEFEADHDATVEVGADSITWSITFDGPLGDYAADHARGSVIGFGVALAGPSQPTTDAATAAFTCGPVRCGEVIGDFAFTDARYKIG